MAIGTTNFPTALDTATELVEVTNNASTALTSAITNSQTTITITDPAEFASSGFATIVDDLTTPTKIEIISYTGKSGSDLTGVTRGAQGTSAQAFSTGYVECRYTKGTHEALRGAIIAVETKLGYGSDTAANGHVLIGNGAGTSEWRALIAGDIPSVLSVTKLSNLTSNGFVKTSGSDGTLSVDTNTYLTGNQSISLSGDVTGSGTTAITTTIASGAVTYAKMQNVSAQYRILARKSASAGSVEECTLSEVLDFVTSAAQGDILYRGASSWSRLGAGTNGHFLKTQGLAADPVWAAVSASPGGTNTQLQYNNSSAFGGITGATSDGTNVTFGSTNLRATSPQISTSLTTDSASFDLLNATATTINFGGAATAINLAGGSGAAVTIGGGANAAELRFLEPSGGGGHYTAFKAQAQAGNVTYTLPAADGSNGQMLSTNGSGTLSWATGGGGGGITIGTTTITSGTNTRVLYNNSGVVGEYVITGTGNVVMSTGPTLTDFTLSGDISAAAWTTNGVRIKGVASTLTDTTSSGTVDVAVTNALGGNTIAASNATVFTDYFTTRIAPPTAGTNVTLTRSWALGLTGGLQVAPTARTGSPARGFQLITPADTALTASTENIFAQFGGDASSATVTRTWATGAITTQRENVFVAPTYDVAAGVSRTITTAATVAITGAPVAASGTTITNAFALDVSAGATTATAGRFVGVSSHSTSSPIFRVDTSASAGGSFPAFAVLPKGASTNGGPKVMFGSDVGSGKITFEVSYSTMLIQDGGIGATGAALGVLSTTGWGVGTATYTSGQLYVVSGATTRVGLRVDSAANSTVALNQFYLDADDTATVAPHSVFAVDSNGSVAAGFGGQLQFQIESSTTAKQDAAAINWLWTDHTHATRTAALSFSTVQNAGSLTERARVTFDGTRSHFILGNGATAASPTAGLVQATSGSGTDIAGADLILAGGQPTGNGTAGQLVRKYSLVGATGTTLRSLSSNNYNIPSVMFTSTADAAVTNTVSETTIIGSGVGTTTVEAGMWRVGRTIRVRVTGYLTTTSTPTLQIRFKLGSTTIADTGAVTLSSSISGNEFFEALIDITCRTIGATGTVFGNGILMYHLGSGTANMDALEAFNTAAVTVDTTAAQAVNITAQWGTANPNNSIVGTTTTIEILN